MPHVYDSIDARGVNAANLSVLLEMDPANPSFWCGYGEMLAAAGETAKAAAAFDRALAIGPNHPPVLMRAANFDFMNGRTEQALHLGARILRQVNVYDEILYSYYVRSGHPLPALLGYAVPATPRVARTWVDWMRRQGSDQDLRDTWAWMRKEQLADENTAALLSRTLWERRSFQAAQEIWADWIRSLGDLEYLTSERLSNRLFQRQPSGSPFDWELISTPGVEAELEDGLELRFLGQQNLEFAGARQLFTAPPGRYRFSAEVKAGGITTDQGPFFRIFDLESPARVNAVSAPILGRSERTRVQVEFSVPPGSQILAVQIERKPSLRFDSKIAGSLHVHRVSISPASAAPR